MGDIEHARAAFTQELALDPDDFLSNLNMGVLAKQDQEYMESAPLFRARAQGAPERSGRALSNRQLSTWPPAIRTRRARRWKRLIAESPDFAEAHATLATGLLPPGPPRRRRSRTRHREEAHRPAGRHRAGSQTQMKRWLAAGRLWRSDWRLLVGGRRRPGAGSAPTAFHRYRPQVQLRLPHRQQFHRPQVFPADHVRRRGRLRFRQRRPHGSLLHQRRQAARIGEDRSALLQLPAAQPRRRHV